MIKTVSGRKEISKDINLETLLELCKSITEQIKKFTRTKKKIGLFKYHIEYDNPFKKLRPTLIIERQIEVKDDNKRVLKQRTIE